MDIEFQNHVKPASMLSDLIDVQIYRMRRYYRKGSLTVLHVGGFNGEWDVDLWKRHKPITIHSFEPYVRSFKKLKSNTSEIADICPYRVAIHPFKKSIKLYVPSVGDKRLYQSTSIFSSFVENKSENDVVEAECNAIGISAFCRKKRSNRIDLLRINCEGSEFDIFDHKESQTEFLENTNVLALTLHGKSPVFLTPEKMNQKVRITKMLKRRGFALIYGHDFETKYKVPTGHVWQLWSRDTFVG